MLNRYVALGDSLTEGLNDDEATGYRLRPRAIELNNHIRATCRIA